MYRAAILFLQGGMATTAVLPLEILRSVGVFWNTLNKLAPEPRFEITTVSSDGNPVQIRDYKILKAAHSFSSLPEPDVVVVPSAGFDLGNGASSDGSVDQPIGQNIEVVPWLKRWWRDGAHLVGIGSGVGLMAAAGLLDGVQATTHWGFLKMYRERFPKVDWRSEFSVTHSDRLYSSSGFSSGTDVILTLVENLCGPEIALQTAMALLIDIPRTRHVLHGEDITLGDGREDETVRKAEAWLSTHFEEEVSFERLASDLGMSHRNFTRRFRSATGDSPRDYLQQMRISTAIRLLEDTRLPIQTIAHRVGYNDMTHFRELFRRHTGQKPSAYRRRFSGGAKNGTEPEAG